MLRPVLVILAGLAALAIATTSLAATLTIEPADTSVANGDTLTLRVVVTPVADLKGYEIVHAYDPVRLASLEIRAGDVLTGPGRSYAAYAVPEAAAPNDTTWLDAAMLDGTASGPGVLAYLVFKATANGVAHVTCESVLLRDSENATIDADCAGGIVRISAPVPVRRATWGTLKAAYR